MTSYMTSADLIASVKRRAAIPESQVTFTEQDFLDLANEELAIGLVPSILTMHEEYFVYSEDTALVNGQIRYPIPYRAIGNRLREISYLDSNGNEFPMARINPEDAYNFTPLQSQSSINAFKIEGGNIVLLASENSSLIGTLRFRYFLRPNVLVLPERGGKIIDINRTTGVITFDDEAPEHFSLSLLYDFNRTRSDHRIIEFDVEASAVGLNFITFPIDSIPDTLEVGDYVCQSGETVIPNVPSDLHVVLAQRVGTRCLESMGDTQGLQNANAKLQEMEVKTGSLIDNRVEGSAQKVINRTSNLKYGTWRRWRGIR